MFLDLHEIIEVPGGRVPFRCELDRDRLDFPSLVGFHGPVTVWLCWAHVQKAAGFV